MFSAVLVAQFAHQMHVRNLENWAVCGFSCYILGCQWRQQSAAKSDVNFNCLNSLQRFFLYTNRRSDESTLAPKPPKLCLTRSLTTRWVEFPVQATKALMTTVLELGIFFARRSWCLFNFNEEIWLVDKIQLTT